MEQNTILFIMPRLPFPATSGRKTSLYYYCKILSHELGNRLVIASFLEQGDDVSLKPDFIDRLVILPRPSAREKIGCILLKSFMKKELPLQASIYYSKKAKKIIDQLVEEEHPRIIIGDMVRCVEYLRDREAYTIADLDDRISKRYERQLDVSNEDINPYGAFINTVPQFLKKFIQWKPIETKVMRQEILLLKRYEIEAGLLCDKVIFVAKQEAEQYNKDIGQNKAMSVPNGVDTSFFSYRRCGSRDKIIGFLGAMNVAHNSNAVKHFINDIFPSVLNRIPDAVFLVIGGGASEDLMSLASNRVVFTGRVDDVREYLQSCSVFVCPMTFGSGIKTKLLEAMSIGLPVVTTTVGAENIDAINHRDWIVENDDNLFSEEVINLLENAEDRERLAKNGSRFIRDNFSWEVTQRKFEQLIESI